MKKKLTITHDFVGALEKELENEMVELTKTTENGIISITKYSKEHAFFDYPYKENGGITFIEIEEDERDEYLKSFIQDVSDNIGKSFLRVDFVDESTIEKKKYLYRMVCIGHWWHVNEFDLESLDDIVIYSFRASDALDRFVKMNM